MPKTAAANSCVSYREWNTNITVESTRRPKSNPPYPHQFSYEPRSRRSRPTICWVAFDASQFLGTILFVKHMLEISDVTLERLKCDVVLRVVGHYGRQNNDITTGNGRQVILSWAMRLFRIARCPQVERETWL